MSFENAEVRGSLITALANSALLREVGRQCPQSERLRAMLARSEVQSFPRGQVIIREGQRSDRMFFLIAGAVRVSKQGEAVCTLERVGDVFGEVGALTGKVRSATVTAIERVTCVVAEPDTGTGMEAGKEGELADAFQRALTNLLVKRLQETTVELASAKRAAEGARNKVGVLNRQLKAKEEENKELNHRLQKYLGWSHRQDPKER